MTVYVDDAGISATVHNPATGRDIASNWSHLIADTQDELHRFAAGKLGLRRSYFQPGKPGGDGRPSPFWHYDLTEGKRWQAIRHGAVPVTSREMNQIIAEREARARGPLEGDAARVPRQDPARRPGPGHSHHRSGAAQAELDGRSPYRSHGAVPTVADEPGTAAAPPAGARVSWPTSAGPATTEAAGG